MADDSQSLPPKAMFCPPSVQTPTSSTLKNVAESLELKITDDDLNVYQEEISKLMGSYNRVAKMAEVKLPVKYPRTPGYKPPPEENKYNAWYYKVNIEGAGQGKLHGKRIAIKDNICLAGLPMMNGTSLLEGFTPDIDATVVTRVLDAGCLIVGKAVCEPLCFSGSGHLADTGPVLNPHDTTRCPGSSSSGCGVLVSVGEVDMAIGGDQGGSIRIPASWCGIVGLKPTFGLVPYSGCMSLEYTIDHCGPMANNVYDCALLLEVVAGPDGRDHRQINPLKLPEYTKELTKDVSGLKVGLVTEGFDHCDEQVSNTVRLAASKLRQAGILVENCSIPVHKQDASDVWTVISIDGSYNNMMKCAGHEPGVKGFYDTAFIKHVRNAHNYHYKVTNPPLTQLSLAGEYVTKNYNYGFYAKAMNVLPSIVEAYDKALAEYDVIVMPTLPYLPPKIPDEGASTAEHIKTALGMVPNTAPFDATGHPALSINAGFIDGLPVGMMIIGKHFEDATVLRVAHAFEKIRDEN